jgi:hypothetical protein
MSMLHWESAGSLWRAVGTKHRYTIDNWSGRDIVDYTRPWILDARQLAEDGKFVHSEFYRSLDEAKWVAEVLEGPPGTE